MPSADPEKSSVDEIRARFDADVDRFSSLEVGQQAAMDSPLCLDLIAEAAAVCSPSATDVLDIGCGAGNYTLKVLERLPNLKCSLVDLSQPMLDRAAERVGSRTTGQVVTRQGDIREITFPEGGFDVILAASVFHHLRTDAEWRAVFASLHSWLRPGGSVWIYDLILQDVGSLHTMMERRYGDYLSELGDDTYRDHVFAYIEREDTPRSLMDQLRLLQDVGFQAVDVLHKNSLFAAFGAVKGE